MEYAYFQSEWLTSKPHGLDRAREHEMAKLVKGVERIRFTLLEQNQTRAVVDVLHRMSDIVASPDRDTLTTAKVVVLAGVGVGCHAGVHPDGRGSVPFRSSSSRWIAIRSSR